MAEAEAEEAEQEAEVPYTPPTKDGWSVAELQEALSHRAVEEIFILKSAGGTGLRVKLKGGPFRNIHPKGVPLTMPDVQRLARTHRVPLRDDIPPGGRWPYSFFMRAVEKGWVLQVVFRRDEAGLRCLTRAGSVAAVDVPNDPELISKLLRRGITVDTEPPPGLLSEFKDILVNMVGYLIVWRIFLWVSMRFMGGPMGLFRGEDSVVKSSDKSDRLSTVTFADVAGVDDAKAELQEVVDFLKNPAKYSALGATIPKGVLLIGPPGTGKTLLAKAVAGEACVPFIYSAASSFVEMFAGLGASRVRSLFAEAKKKTPCIIFLDELDSVGRSRDSTFGGGAHEEREQTLNQLLTEMDGFVENSGVIVIAATNRADMLDRALLRPGRFDRQVAVDPPDVVGREAILKVHARGRPLATDVDLRQVARRTPGFTGADLRNLLNEAAIWASRRKRADISPREVDDALERLLVGPVKSNAATNEARRRLVAYHEAGHALVGALLTDFDAIAKVSIIPRGRAGGLTFFSPSEDHVDYGLYTRTYLEQKILVAFGGRVSEELIFGEANATTGAMMDFVEATRIATSMVASQGFSENVGPMAVNVGGMLTSSGIPPASEDMTRKVDEEVQRLLRASRAKTRELLEANLPVLHKIAARLMAKETMDGAEVLALLRGEDLPDEPPPSPAAPDPAADPPADGADPSTGHAVAAAAD
eukprot:EG_transcript_2787